MRQLDLSPFFVTIQTVRAPPEMGAFSLIDGKRSVKAMLAT